MNKSEFIVGNKYIITGGALCDRYPHKAKGLVLTALHDDGSLTPPFKLPDGLKDEFGDNWAFFNVINVEPHVESESIQPFVVMGVGDKWHILKPSGEYVNIYFNTTQAAFAVARTLAEVYNA